MTSLRISRELDSLNLDGISRLLSNQGKQLEQNQAMSRAEAVSLDRERQSLKNRYTSLLVDLDARFTRLKEALVPRPSGKKGSEVLGCVDDVSANPRGDHLLHRARRLSSTIQKASDSPETLVDLKKAYRNLVRRYNVLVKTGNLAKRSARNRVRATLVEIALQFRRVQKARRNRDP